MAAPDANEAAPPPPAGGAVAELLRLLPKAVAFITGPWNRQNALGWLKVLAALLILKGLVLDVYTIPSGSMDPTLKGEGQFATDDRVLVNKWLYGPRIPFTNIRLWEWSAPKRWDIVVFSSVEGSSGHRILVKRVAGLPGERVSIAGGQLVVNGEVVPFPPSMPEATRYVNDTDLQRMITQLPPPQAAIIEAVREAYPYRYGAGEDEAFTVVPEGRYWMLGDNSLNSIDGRVWGWVPQSHLHGRVIGIAWPWRNWRDFTGFSKTWWGRLLLFGLPMALVLGEARHVYVERGKHRTAGKEDIQG